MGYFKGFKNAFFFWSLYVIRRFSGTDFCILMSQSWIQECFCRAKLYHHENIHCSCSNTFCDSQLKKVGRAASNGNMMWPNFSLLVEGIWISWYFESQIYKVCVTFSPEFLIFFSCLHLVIWSVFFFSHSFFISSLYSPRLYGDCQGISSSLDATSSFASAFVTFMTLGPGNRLTWLGAQFIFPWVIMCMWFERYNLIIFFNGRGTNNLSSTFSNLIHDLKDRATTWTPKWADHFAVPMFTMAYCRKNIP